MENAAGPDPAAGALILNADERPCRAGTAASDAAGRSVDHGRAYKATPLRRQATGVIACPRETPPGRISRQNLRSFRVRTLIAHGSEWRHVSNRRIPRRRNDAVAVTVLFEMSKPRERIMECLDLQFLSHHHVVNAPAGLLRHIRFLVEERVPVWVSGEWIGIVGDVRLDEYLSRPR